MKKLSRRARQIRFLGIIALVFGGIVSISQPSVEGINNLEDTYPEAIIMTSEEYDIFITEEEIVNDDDNNEWEVFVNNSVENLTTNDIDPILLNNQEIVQIADELCEEYNFPLDVFLGLINQESTFKVDAYNPDGSYGLAQINKVNHEWLSEELGIEDFYDPTSNLEAGLYLLKHYEETYKPDSMHMLLMMYNMGPNRAKDFFNDNIFSTNYSKDIIRYANNLNIGI